MDFKTTIIIFVVIFLAIQFGIPFLKKRRAKKEDQGDDLSYWVETAKGWREEAKYWHEAYRKLFKELKDYEKKD
jgi:hypothetical protein